MPPSTKSAKPRKSIVGRAKSAVKKLVAKSHGDIPIPGVDLKKKVAVGEHGGAPVESYVGTGAGLDKIYRHIQASKAVSDWAPRYPLSTATPTEEDLSRMHFGSVLVPELPQIVTGRRVTY